MGMQQRYLQAVLGVRRGEVDALELTPSVLAAAAVAVLPVTASGVSLSLGNVRVPLGWSSAAAAAAERQQTTLGNSPHLSAASAGRTILADASDIARRWPVYYAEIENRTPFRSVAALPLRVEGQPVFATLSLYAARPDLGDVLDLDEAEVVAQSVADLLFGILDQLYDYDERDLPTWMEEQGAIDRAAVWSAVGLMVSDTDPDDTATLTRLHVFAQSNNLTLSDAVTRLLERQTLLQAVAHWPEPFDTFKKRPT